MNRNTHTEASASQAAPECGSFSQKTKIGKRIGRKDIDYPEDRELTAPEIQERISELQTVVEETATDIHANHPAGNGRRDLNLDKTAARLVECIRHEKKTGAGAIELLRLIRDNHGAIRASFQWTKDDNAYAKSLSNWLSPAAGLYLMKPSRDNVMRMPAAGTRSEIPWRSISEEDIA